MYEEYVEHGRKMISRPDFPGKWAVQITACFPTIRSENPAVVAAFQHERNFIVKHPDLIKNRPGLGMDVFWAALLSIGGFWPEINDETLAQHLIRVYE